MKTKTTLKIFVAAMLIVTTVMQTKSQQTEFAPDGARWWYSYLEFESMPPYSHILNPSIYEVVGDTTINNRHCKIVCQINLNTGDCNLILKKILFDSSGYVLWYMAEVDSFVTLYNFNAEKGDTWETIIYTYSNCADTFTIMVDSTDYRTINNQNLKVLYLSTVNQFNVPYSLTGPTVERLGNMRHLFPLPTGCFAGGYDFFFRCYEDSTLSLYKLDAAIDLPYHYLWDTLSCGESFVLNTYLQDIKEECGISVFPTLAVDRLNINSKCLKYADKNIQYQITNVHNQVVKSGHLVNEQAAIDISNLHKGLFFINFFSQPYVNNTTHINKTIKFIKTK